MQISQKKGGWSKSHEKKPIRLEREYFLKSYQKGKLFRNLKELADLDPWPLPGFR